MMKNTSLCYLEKDGCYLMLHRTKKEQDENQEKWIGVGGKFEEKESPEDCVKREVWEETGFRLDEVKFRGIVTFVSDQWPTEYMHLFTSKKFHGQQMECSEGDLEWIKKEDIYQLSLWEGDKIFLRLLEEDHPFFSLKLVYEGEHLREAVLNGVLMLLEN